ncbi:hypothetical protein VPHZ6_orf00052 [Vibrio phage VPHZ6]|nr:hypothetical protein VPHZ6_orf00052 [Vibrio phage VPHZ6]
MAVSFTFLSNVVKMRHGTGELSLLTRLNRRVFLCVGFMEQTESKQVHVAVSDRLFFGVAVTVIASLLLWVGTTLNSNQIELGKLQVEVAQLREESRRAITENRDLLRRVGEIEKDVAGLKQQGRN